MEESLDLKGGAGAGLSQLLFAPVFLVGEILGVLLPGLLFCLILLLKGHRTTFAPFDLTFLGYRTKLFAFLLIAYVIGKILTAPFRLSLSIIIEKSRTFGNKKPDEKSLSEIKPEWAYALAGAVTVPTMLDRPRIVDYLMMGFATMNFTIGTGLGLLILSFVPGDPLGARILEGASGAILVVETWKSTKTIGGAVVVFAGYVLRDFLSKVPPASWPALIAAWKAIEKVARQGSIPAPPPKAEEAGTNGTPGPGHQA